MYELKDSDEESEGEDNSPVKKCKVVDEEEEPVADVEKSRPDVDHAAEGSADEHDEEKTHVEDEEESDSDRPIKVIGNSSLSFCGEFLCQPFSHYQIDLDRPRSWRRKRVILVRRRRFGFRLGSQ